jgi:hypothetical protein
MPEEFQLQIPTGDGTTVVALKVGGVLYVLGANGTGKSSLVSRFFNGNKQHARRISAHRQTWFESNALDMTPRARQQLEGTMRAQDAQPKSRYWDWNPSGRSSLDVPLYGLLFPYVSVISKGGCKEVEHAVKGLRGSRDMHWVAAWGIVDNDQRSAEEIESLREAGVWALDHYSAESLYFHPSIFRRVAERQANLTGDDAEVLVASAMEDAVKAANDQKEHLVAMAVLRSVRRDIFGALPKKDEIENEDRFGVEIDIASRRNNESERFDAPVAAKDWDGLLTRHALRESGAFDRAISGIKIADQATYRAAVLKLLQDDPAAAQELLELLGDLPAQMVN